MEDGLKLFEFVNNSFSNTIKSALENKGRDKRKVNSRKYIEKNRQKTGRKSLRTVNRPKVTTSNKSQSRRLQQIKLLQQDFNEGQCLPPWPSFDNGYTILPACSAVQEPSILLPTSFGPSLGQQDCIPIMQSTLDLEQMLHLYEPPVSVSLPPVSVATASLGTTVDYTIDYISDHSRPLSPYDSPELSSNISEKELEDLLMDQLQASPASYSSSPIASCVPSPRRSCEPQMVPTMGYTVYDNISMFH